MNMKKTLTAPVRNGQKIGEIRYYLYDTLYYKESIHVPDSIDAITLPYCIRQSIRHFSALYIHLNVTVHFGLCLLFEFLDLDSG